MVISYNSPRISNPLHSLRRQSSPPKEIILVEAGKSILRDSEHWKVILDPQGSQSHSRNIGAKAATGDIIAFLDSDCVAPQSWIARIQNRFELGEKAIGGPYVPGQNTEFAKEAHDFITHSFGKMSATFSGINRPQEYVKTVSGGNCAFDRAAFEKACGFDERQHWREEPELCRKIREGGAKILFDPELWVWHWWKGWDGLLPLAKQGYFYGRIRVKSQREIER